MEVIRMGKTSLPPDVIAEYLDSLGEVYTPESYDLFLHNCNNFSNDFCTFLVGKGIPDHITSLPQTVLDTPFGQMLRPQLDSAMRSVTQAPTPSSAAVPRSSLATMSSGNNIKLTSNGHAAHIPTSHKPVGTVHNVTTLAELDPLLESAKRTCAVIFFTSATCPPCKLAYPAYDELAVEGGNRAILIKVDISKAYDIASQYKIRATPTFVTFLHGEKENEWTGANPSQLLGNVRMLFQMASHPHTRLSLPNLLQDDQKPVLFSKLPPLEKLRVKMGDAGRDPAVTAISKFISDRATSGAAEASLPDLRAFGSFIQHATQTFPTDTLFTAVDLLRAAMADARVSGVFAEEPAQSTLASFIGAVNDRSMQECPYALRLVALQAVCNAFSSPLYASHVLASGPTLTTPVVQLLTTSLLDDQHPSVRVASASLAFNIASANLKSREDAGEELLPENEQVELCASLLEAISAEEGSTEALSGLLRALGLLLYCTSEDAGIRDLVKVMDAAATVKAKGKLFPKEVLVQEIGTTLLEKGMS
ncbi:MAG: hypothetical protein M1825_005983 [Sarcosagium campestre]|nr:MAG: hypothetical protein M1825_005983 [Sarcosagium campestre]